MKKICIISFSELSRDPRVKRQIYSLSSLYEVCTIGYGSRPRLVVDHLQLSKPDSKYMRLLLFLMLQLRLYWLAFFLYSSHSTVFRYIASQNPSAFILNDVISWPFIRGLPSSKCLMDAHEFSPLEMQNSLSWRLFIKPYKIWCSHFGRHAAAVTSVESHLCEKWQELLGRRVTMIRNVAMAPKSTFQYPTMQDADNDYWNGFSDGNPIRILHHGGVNPSRRLDLMLKAVQLAGPSITADFVLSGLGRDSHSRLLRSLAGSVNNIRLLPPVSSDQLIELGRNYSAGFISVYPTNYNNRYCFPNKFFEFLQSGLPVVVGPTPAMADIVLHYNCGIVAEGFEPADLASALRSLTLEKLQEFKPGVQAAARDLCWQKEQALLQHAMNSIVHSTV